MRRVSTAGMAWEESRTGVRQKSVTWNGHRVRVVEFGSGFHEPDWCEKGHIGYVQRGVLEVGFTEGVRVFSAGDMLLIGEQERHRARVIEGPVLLFLVESAEPARTAKPASDEELTAPHRGAGEPGAAADRRVPAATDFIDPCGANLNEVRRVVHRVVDMALAARATAGLRPPAPSSHELPAGPHIPAESRPDEAILRDLGVLIAGANSPSNPDYIAHMGAVSSVMSPLGDFVATCLNNNLIGLELSPSFSRLEDAVVRQLAAYFGLGPDAGGVITTGGSLANLHALVVARNAVLGTLDQSVHSLRGRPVVLASEAAHASVTKGAMILGLGSSGALSVRAAEGGRMDLADLRSKYDEAIAAGAQPFAVVATAGTTVTGSIDPIAEIGAFARERALWFHVDAAWGGGLQFSPRLRQRLRGTENADSVTFCPQKLLLVGLSSAVVMFRDMRAMARHFRTSFPYMRDQGDFTNLCEIGVQGSRPAEILKLWLTLQHVGEARFAELIEKWVSLADAVADRVSRRPFLAAVSQPESAIVCFRGVPSWVQPDQWDQWSADLHGAIARRTGIYLSLVPYHGARWLRAVFANPFTGASVVDRLFAVIDEYAAESQEDRL